MNFFERNKTLILTCTGLGIIGFGIYYLVKEHKNKQAALKPIFQTSESDSLANSSLIFKKQQKYINIVKHLRTKIEQEKAKGGLTKETIIAVNQAILELFRQEYIPLFVQIRDRRRKMVKDIPHYIQEFVSGAQATENLLGEATAEVAKDLNLNFNFFESECEKIARTDPNFSMYMLYMMESLKVQIPAKRSTPLTEDEVVKSLEFQLENLEKAADPQFSVLPPPEAALCKQTLVADLTYLKFGFEEEDLMRNVHTITKSERVMALQRKLQQKIMQSQSYQGFA